MYYGGVAVAMVLVVVAVGLLIRSNIRTNKKRPPQDCDERYCWYVDIFADQSRVTSTHFRSLSAELVP